MGNGQGSQEPELHSGTQLTPVVRIKNDTVYANSRDVAEFFGKQHKNVLADIHHLTEEVQEGSAEISAYPWFIRRYERSVQNGQLYPHYDMTRDGFTLLVMGYTGAKAMQFKE